MEVYSSYAIFLTLRRQRVTSQRLLWLAAGRARGWLRLFSWHAAWLLRTNSQGSKYPKMYILKVL